MPWHGWCTAHSRYYSHDDDGYCDELYDEETGELIHPSKNCTREPLIAAKLGFDNDITMNLTPVEREQIILWMKT